uniref:Uncharacterized protein n=1 Tax=Glossina austeni TaxID=7395 RepID=A0A1A9V5K5_GLOAU
MFHCTVDGCCCGSSSSGMRSPAAVCLCNFLKSDYNALMPYYTPEIPPILLAPTTLPLPCRASTPPLPTPPPHRVAEDGSAEFEADVVADKDEDEEEAAAATGTAVGDCGLFCDVQMMDCVL